jgi:hypothetical protein
LTNQDQTSVKKWKKTAIKACFLPSEWPISFR